MSLKIIITLVLLTLSSHWKIVLSECRVETLDDLTIVPKIQITDSHKLTQFQNLSPNMYQLIIQGVVAGKNNSKSNNKSITLNCTSTWPIQWKFKGLKVNTFVTTFNDYVTYNLPDYYHVCYHTSLTFTFNVIAEGITGEYECTHLNKDKDLGSKIPILKSVVDQITSGTSRLIVYAGHTLDESSPQYLIERSKTINVAGVVVPETKDGATAFVTTTFFPCAINHPEVRNNVTLFQKTISLNSTTVWKILDPTTIEVYKPWLGFTIRTDLDPRRPIIPRVVEYKCETGFTGDVVHFTSITQPAEFILFPAKGHTKTHVISTTSPTTFGCAHVSTSVKIQLKVLFPNINYDFSIRLIGNTSIYYKHVAQVTLTYLNVTSSVASPLPQPLIGEIYCITDASNETIGTWMYSFEDYVSIPLTLNHTSRVATCTSDAIDDVQIVWIPCETITECEFRSTCMDEFIVVHEDGECPQLPPILARTSYSISVQLPLLSGYIQCKSTTAELDETRSYYVSARDDGSISEDIRIYKIDKLYFHCDFKSSILITGDSIDCICRISSRLLTKDILWTFVWKNDSERIVQSEFISNDSSTFKSNGLYSRSSSIQIHSVDIMIVKCVAFQTPALVGTGNSPMYYSRYNLSIKARPILIEGLHYQTLHLNESATNIVLECIVESYPTANLVWNVPPKAQDLITRYEVKLSTILTSAQLSLSKFDKTIQGEYSCEAFYDDSSYPKQRKTFRLVVTGVDEGFFNDNATLVGIIALVLFLLACVVAGVTSWLLIQARRKKSDIISHSKHVEEFLVGVSELELTNMDEIEGYAGALLLPYDHSKYEISFEHLEFGN